MQFGSGGSLTWGDREVKRRAECGLNRRFKTHLSVNWATMKMWPLTVYSAQPLLSEKNYKSNNKDDSNTVGAWTTNEKALKIKTVSENKLLIKTSLHLLHHCLTSTLNYMKSCFLKYFPCTWRFSISNLNNTGCSSKRHLMEGHDG